MLINFHCNTKRDDMHMYERQGARADFTVSTFFPTILKSMTLQSSPYKKPNMKHQPHLNKKKNEQTQYNCFFIKKKKERGDERQPQPLKVHGSSRCVSVAEEPNSWKRDLRYDITKSKTLTVVKCRDDGLVEAVYTILYIYYYYYFCFASEETFFMKEKSKRADYKR